MSNNPETRRALLLGMGGLVLASCSGVHRAMKTPTTGAFGPDRTGPDAMAAGEDEESDFDEGGTGFIMPASEDLTRGHGVVTRILLVYEESAHRLESGQTLPMDALSEAIDVTRRFVEEFHATCEEEEVFPRFEQANKLVELTRTLRQQHQVGRQITGDLARLVGSGASEGRAGRARTIALLRGYARMFRPHEAREDTVLFPAMREIMTANTFSEVYGRIAERKEAVGDFASVVQEVAQIERQFGLHELEQFTARV